MPPIFKTLASITVWVLFLVGWDMLFGAYFRIFGVTSLGPISTSEWPSATLCFTGAIACFILSVCAMKLRKMLE
jgi:hypothetical protein